MGRSSNENIMPDNTFMVGRLVRKLIVINGKEESHRVDRCLKRRVQLTLCLALEMKLRDVCNLLIAKTLRHTALPVQRAESGKTLEQLSRVLLPRCEVGDRMGMSLQTNILSLL